MSAQDTVTGSFGDFTEDFTSGGYDSDFNYGDSGSDSADVSVGANGSTTPTMFDKLGGYLSKLAGGTASAGDYAGLASLVYGLSGGNKPSASPGWRGKIDPNKYAFNQKRIEQPKYKAYSNSSTPVMGRSHFETPTYAITPAAAARADAVAASNQAAANRAAAAKAIADKGIADYDAAQNARITSSTTVIPNTGSSGVGDMYDNIGGGGDGGGNFAAGGLMHLAHGGSAKQPRYLQGITDGMADKLPTNIDGKQPAALSHGEFVIPADVVSHLGNGNSEAGAKQLYKMMDRIREARTGTKKQGKRINPEKFTPGGIAGYAGGGVVAFSGATGSLVTTGQGASGSNPVTSESNLSEWAAPGIVDYIEKGTALANQPYQAYQGPLVAGTSPLQKQAFSTASNLSIPASVGQGANMISSAGDKLGNLSYNAAPVSSAYKAPTQYTAGQLGNLYSGTGAYTGSKIGVDDFNTANMKQYMNPYLQMSLDPQIAEARRQNDITNLASQAKLTQAGAFGGSRDAIMRAEANRNLGQNLANITGQGYNTAFNTAMDAFNKQQGLDLQAQQYNEASRQFGATQALNNAQNAAQYGLARFNANEQAKQTQGAQGLTNAQNAAQYGLAGQQLNAQQQQFGANLGLSGLQGKVNAGTALGNLGLQQNQAGIANLSALSGLGETQRGIEQQGIDALYKQYEQERLDPYKQIQFQQSLYQGLPVSTVTGSTATTGMQDLMGTINNALAIGRTVNGVTG